MFFQRKKVPSPARKLLERDRRVFLGFSCLDPGQSGQISDEVSLCQIQEEEPQHFAHLGYTNFSTFHFALVKMMRVSVTRGGCSLLRTDRKNTSGIEVAGGEVQTDMHFIRDFLDFSLQWRVTVYIMSENQSHWPSCAFEQHELVPVLRFHDVQPFLVWRGSEREEESRKRASSQHQPGQRPSRKRDEPDGLDGAQLLLKKQPAAKRQRTQKSIPKTVAPPCQNADDDDDLLGLFDLGDVVDQQQTQNPDQVSESDILHELEMYGALDNTGAAEHLDSEEEEELVAAALAQLASDPMEAEGSEAEQGLSPHDSDSDSSSESDSSSSDSEIQKPRVSASAAAAPSAESAPDAEGPEGQDKRERRPTVRNANVSEVLKIGSHGELRYHPVMKVLTAVCNEPDHDDCRRRRTVVASDSSRTKNQRGQGRPVGHLIAWLRAQGKHSSQHDHCHDFKCTRAERVAAREYLYTLPQGKEFADEVERPKRADEEDEPEAIS